MSAPPTPAAEPATAGPAPRAPGLAPVREGGGPGAADALSILDFITDGSLAGLCDEMSRLTGIPVSLRDREGRRIVRAAGPRPWALEPAPAAEPGEERVPLIVDGQMIGTRVLGPADAADTDTREHIRGTLRLLASTAVELC